MVDAEKHLYDIIDNTIPADLDYSKCRIPGETATIIFQSGVMTGEEFDLEQTSDALTGYDHAARRFKLVPVEKEGGTIPNPNRCPAVGDTYAVFNISLPQDTSATMLYRRVRHGICSVKQPEACTTRKRNLLPLPVSWTAFGRNRSGWRWVDGWCQVVTSCLTTRSFQPEGVRIRITL